MKSNKKIVFSTIFTIMILTLLIWLTAGNLANRFDVVNEKYFNFYYPWQTRDPSVMAYVTSWVGYALHNILVWGIMIYAKKEKPKHEAKFRWFNWAMLAVNLVFFGGHWVQTQIWYDGLAISVPEVTSQGSVILMLVLVLILETPRRGLIFGKKIKFHKKFLQVVREYHGYIISWGLIYTFWYHPMENTFGHLAGFFYMFLLLAQSVFIYHRIHLNKYWVFALETFVLIHGTTVAIYQGKGLWPMFAFGFGAMIIITQIYSLGLNDWVRRAIGASFVIGIGLFYGLSGNWAGLNEVIRIPFIEIALVFVLYGLFMAGYGVVKLIEK